MAVFSLANRSSGSAYFFIETVTTGSFYDENSVKGALGTYSNFTGSTISNFVTSSYIMGYVVPPGSSSFEFVPTTTIPSESVWFRGTGEITVTVTV